MKNPILDNDPFGVLVVDKAKGMTSHDVVDRVRRQFRINKVGHAGTLDPNATGVLVLLLGKATKLSGNFISQEKEYEAVMKLGERTDSADSDGEVTMTREVSVSKETIVEAAKKFTGEIDQIPPMYSAKKVNGKKLYDLARKGIEVERRPKKVTIKEFEIKKVDLPFVSFRVVSSSGTYIRQIAHDLGEALGCGAHLTDLRRMRSGEFGIEKAVPLDKLYKMDRASVVKLASFWAVKT